MFGIEDFREKPNGNGTIEEFLHSNIAARNYADLRRSTSTLPAATSTRPTMARADQR